jgi:uncharacterized protein with GYD domain
MQINKEDDMPTYVMLLNWTDQGSRTAKETITRATAARQTAQALGARVTANYWTRGQYDVVLIVEAPDDETVSRLALSAGLQGTIRTMTMRAFTEEEMGRILQGLP